MKETGKTRKEHVQKNSRENKKNNRKKINLNIFRMTNPFLIFTEIPAF